MALLRDSRPMVETLLLWMESLTEEGNYIYAVTTNNSVNRKDRK